MRIKSLAKAVFLHRFSSQQVSYALSFTVCLGVLAVAFDYLDSSGVGHVYLSFIPQEVKTVIAQVFEVGALVLAVYFLIRFTLGFWLKEQTKKNIMDVGVVNNKIKKRLQEIKKKRES